MGIVCIGLLPNAQAVVPPPDGGYPGFNAAEGSNALKNLTTGAGNTGIGWYSLFATSTASFNTAVGAGSLLSNTADQNTAFGTAALLLNSGGSSNTAVGVGALSNNTTGNGNIAIGSSARSNVTSSNNNIYIGNEGEFDSDTIRVGNASHARIFIPAINNIAIGAGDAVFINSTTGLLGTVTSSLRFKQNIKPMDNSSEAILALKPVTFRYNQKIDPKAIPQFGLVAEEVEKVNPDLVVRDADEKAKSVRYEAVNAMLLNEFLKEHRKVEDQQATITELKSTVAQQQKDFQATAAEQQKQIEALTAGLQKINAEIEASKAAPQMVNNP